MSRFLKDSVFGTLGALSNSLANFFGTLIVARILGVEGSGTVAFAGWVAGAIITGTCLGLPFAMVRFLPELSSAEGPERARHAAASVIRVGIKVLAIPCLLGIAAAAWLFSGAHQVSSQSSALENPVTILLIAAIALTQGAAEYARGYLRGTQQFARLAKIAVVSALLQVAALWIGSMLFGVAGALFASVLAGFAPLVAFRDLSFGKHRLSDLPERDRLLRYARYRWGAELVNFFVWSRIEIFFLQAFWGAQHVGLLSAALTISTLAVQGPLMLTWGLLPHLSERATDRERLAKMYAAGTRLMGLLILPSCFGLAAISPLVVPLLFGEAFAEAVPVTIILLLASGVTSVTIVGTNLIWALERSDVDFYAGILGAAASVLGAFLLIQPLGLTGAALSRAAAQLLSVSLSTWFLQRKLSMRPPYGHLAKLLVSAIACALIAYVLVFFFPHPSILIVAIPLSAIVYAYAIRSLKAVHEDETEQLLRAADMLPDKLRFAVRQLVVFVARTEK